MKRPLSAPALAAQLLAEAIGHYERNPLLRRQLGIDLKQLAEVNRIRRKLLKQHPK